MEQDLQVIAFCFYSGFTKHLNVFGTGCGYRCRCLTAIWCWAGHVQFLELLQRKHLPALTQNVSIRAERVIQSRNFARQKKQNKTSSWMSLRSSAGWRGTATREQIGLEFDIPGTCFCFVLFLLRLKLSLFITNVLFQQCWKKQLMDSGSSKFCEKFLHHDPRAKLSTCFWCAYTKLLLILTIRLASCRPTITVPQHIALTASMDREYWQPPSSTPLPLCQHCTFRTTDNLTWYQRPLLRSFQTLHYTKVSWKVKGSGQFLLYIFVLNVSIN